MINLLQLMCDEMSSVDRYLYSWEIVDQGVLNHICYSSSEETQKLLNATIKENGDLVATLGSSLIPFGTDCIELQIPSNLIKVNGITPRIIHQYDRSSILTNLYNSLYGQR